MRVCDRQNENIRTIGQVNYAIWKTRQTAATDKIRQWMPCLRMAFDKAKGFESFCQETSPKPRACASYHMTASSNSARATASSLIVTCLCISQSHQRVESR